VLLYLFSIHNCSFINIGPYRQTHEYNSHLHTSCLCIISLNIALLSACHYYYYYYYYLYARGDITLMPFFFVQFYRGLKSCTSLLENVSLRVPPSNLRGFSLLGACPSNKHCPSARCAYAANVVGKYLDIFALGAVYLNYMYAPNCK
jgi:hypothetical protein